MSSAIDTSSQELQQLLDNLDRYEAIVFVENHGVFKELRLTLDNGTFIVAVKADYHINSSTVTRSGIAASVQSAAHTLNEDERLLIDTLTVRIKQTDSSEFSYVVGTDKHFRLTASVLQEAFAGRTVQPELSKESDDLIARLQERLQSMDKFNASVWISYNGFDLSVELITTQNAEYIHLYRRNSVDSFEGLHCRVPDVRCAFQVIQHFVHGTELNPDTLLVKTNLSSKGITAEDPLAVDDALYLITRDFMVGAAGGKLQAVDPSGLDPEALRKTLAKKRHDNLGKLLINCLSNGPAGVAVWSSRPHQEKVQGNYKKLDLSSLNLENIHLYSLNFSGAKFDGASMSGVSMSSAEVKSASFRGADLTKGNLSSCKAQKADFTDAILRDAALVGANLQSATFLNADLSNADFDRADLRGVDLSSCTSVAGAQFKGALYDENTKFPEEFPQGKTMKWKGKGDDPYKKQAKGKAASQAPSDFAGFFQYMQQHFDKPRIDKALSMLKKETFQLFSEQIETGITGVVKSQTDPDTVYSARLNFDGHFCCCTQNLNPCGGLRGALCKHILVLIIGLVKCGELDAARAGEAVICSKLEQPKLDKDAMSEVFIRYKAAEAGEIDWRPTETIPEDYYGF